MDFAIAPLELKLADPNDSAAGEFSGYAAVFGNVDSHGDVIAPGAFKDTLERRTAAGRKHVPMHVQHAILGGDGLPIGVWKSIAEDERGLRVEGKISGMDTDAGRLHFARLKDGAYGGLSIGFRARKASDVKGAGQVKRRLEQVDLHEISLVTDPSNAKALVEEFKSRHPDDADETKGLSNPGKATAAVVAALTLHKESMSGGDSPTSAERSQMLGHLQDAHEALTGKRMPDGMKLATHQDFKTLFVDMGIAADRAEQLAADAIKSARQPSGETKTAIHELGDSLASFSLPNFG